MKPDDVKIGYSYVHAVFGPCVVTLRTRKGFWVECWGGPCGDKLYVFKGVSASELRPLAGKGDGK